MFSKKSNRNLWIIFSVLLVLAILIFSTESTKKERSFREDLVNIDTASITTLIIYPKSQPGEMVEFSKGDDAWKVKGKNSKSYTVPNNKIKNLFSQLLSIEPKRIAARSKAKWNEFQVDSNSTRVVVSEDGSEVLNIVIGKFAFQQPRSMSTYVRLWDENDVYEVDGFLDMTFNKDINSFRNEYIIKEDKPNLKKLAFESEQNNSFELVKVDEIWTVNGIATDSAKTEKFLNDLSRMTSSSYLDDINKEMLPPPIFKLKIETMEDNVIDVFGFQKDSISVIHSSQNPENYFDGNKIVDKIFIKKDSLF